MHIALHHSIAAMAKESQSLNIFITLCTYINNPFLIIFFIGSLYILLPVLCILSFILVLVCLWLLCRRAKKGQSITQKQVKAERAVVHPDFTIPISLRTVAEQLPVVTYERVSNNINSKDILYEYSIFNN